MTDAWLVARVQEKAGANIHDISKRLAIYEGYAALPPTLETRVKVELIETTLRVFLQTGNLPVME